MTALTPKNDLPTKQEIRDTNRKFRKLRHLLKTNGKHVMRKLFDDYLTGPINKVRVPSCIICGSEENITKEHVLPRWVFANDPKHNFVPDVNKQRVSYVKATLPACRRCNCDLLNGIELYIQKTLSRVDLKNRYYSPEEWDNIIRWLEIIDYKFQVWDIATPFTRHRDAEYIHSLSQFSIAFMRHFSIRHVTSSARLALKRMATKDKQKRSNELLVGRTKKKTFYYFHTSGEFIHLEIPTYNKFFFLFYNKTHKSDKAALREAKKILKLVYEQP